MKSKKKPWWMWLIFVAALGVLGWRVAAFMQGLEAFKANTDQIVKDQEHTLQKIDERMEKKQQEIDSLKAKVEGHSVEYKVSGTAKTANVTYTGSKEEMVKVADASLPWSVSFRVKKDLAAVLVAQNPGASGDIVCKIFVDGKEASSKSGSGAGAMVEVDSSIE